MSKRVHFNSVEGSRTKSRKVKDDQDRPGTSAEVEAPWAQKGNRLKDNNTIESDEEEEEQGKQKDFERLTTEDIEGAEDSDVGDEFQDEKIQITPFNLKEEMAEGDFDREGHYHFKKDTDIRDNWMDEIDWSQVKKNEKHSTLHYNEADDDDDQDDSQENFNELKTFEDILNFMNPGESVQNALRRLGASSKPKARGSRSWKRERAYDLEDDDEEDQKVSDDSEEETRKKANFLELTELVDRMAGTGYYDIYTDTYEKLQFKIKKLKPAEVVIPDDADPDDALDMFANDLDERINQSTSSAQTKDNGAGGDAILVVMWEYKWSSAQTQVYGPFSTKQMMQWKDAKYFPDSVITRRVAKDGEDQKAFYPIARVDFELYDD